VSCFFDSQCIYNACLERGAACLHMVQLVPLPSQNHIRSKDITGAPKFRHSSRDPTTPIWFEFDAGQRQTLADPTAPLATCCVQRHSRTTTISRSTQPCIPPWSLNLVPASAGVRAGMSPLPGWEVTLCDPIWHVSSCSGVATLRTAIHLLLTYLLTYLLTDLLTKVAQLSPRDRATRRVSWNRAKCCTHVRRITLEKPCNRRITSKVMQGHWKRHEMTSHMIIPISSVQ